MVGLDLLFWRIFRVPLRLVLARCGISATNRHNVSPRFESIGWAVHQGCHTQKPTGWHLCRFPARYHGNNEEKNAGLVEASSRLASPRQSKNVHIAWLCLPCKLKAPTKERSPCLAGKAANPARCYMLAYGYLITANVSALRVAGPSSSGYSLPTAFLRLHPTDNHSWSITWCA